MSYLLENNCLSFVLKSGHFAAKEVLLLKNGMQYKTENFWRKTFHKAVLLSLGALSNEDGKVNNDGSEKSHFWFTVASA